MRLAMRIFFRKIYLINQERVPISSPIIFACTHPNSFLDDILMATISNRRLNFLARGDVFKKKWSKIILNLFNVHPIYRASEFKNELDKNKETFALSRKILAKNGIIMIHPEGICVHEKRVRSLRKGIGRIAFGAEEQANWNLGLKIVPVALNYTDAPKGGEDVMVLFGNPINVADYKENYLQNLPKSLVELNAEIKTSLDQNTISISNPENDETINRCLLLGRNNLKVEVHSTVSRSNHHFESEKGWADKLNIILDEDRSGSFKQLVNSYFDLLNKNQLKDLNIARICHNISAYLLNLLLYEGVFLTYGFLFNILPIRLAQSITKKKVKLIEFQASVFFLLNFILFHIVYLSSLILLFILFKWWAIPLFIIMIFIAYRTPKNFQKWIHFKGCLKLRKLKKTAPDTYQKLFTLREQIWQKIEA